MYRWRTGEKKSKLHCFCAIEISMYTCRKSGLNFPTQGLISDPRRGCYMGLSTFIFFPATILSGPYLWNRYSQRLQIECAAWSCGLIVHCCLPSNSLRYFILFFFAKILSGPYLWNRYSQRLQIECAAWSCCLILHCCLPSNSLFFPP